MRKFVRTRLRVLFAAALVAVSVPAIAVIVAAGPAGATPAPGTFVPTAVQQLMDTRSGLGGVPQAPLGANATLRFPVGLPEGSTVALHVVVASSTSSGWIAAYPDGGSSSVSVVNYVRGQQQSNLALVAVGTGGYVRVANHSAGSVELAADTSGYFEGGTPAASDSGAYSVTAAHPVMDTRSGLGVPKAALGANATVRFQVGLPAGSTIALHVVVASSTSSGWIAAYPDGGSSSVSVVNYVYGQQQSNLAFVAVGTGGYVRVANHSAGTVQLAADSSGYFLKGPPTGAQVLVGVPATVVMDTRNGTGLPAAGAIGPGGSARFLVAGTLGASARATVALHVVVASSTGSGWIAAYPDGGSSSVSVVNYVKGLQQSALALVPVGADGYVRVANHSAGSVQLSVDVSGYLRPSALSASTSRYVRNISGASSDVTTMNAEGAADAAGGSMLVVLDIGAQRNDKTGVVLSATTTSLTYAQLATATQAYLDGFGSVPGATVVISTNNDAQDWTTYTATQRGTDWATKVINQLHGGTGVAVVGGDDIEPGFFSTEAQAEQWEAAYLTSATTKKLVFTGSADGCPATLGTTNGTCAYGWTQANLNKLAGGLDPAHIKALPQIYVSTQANQWANIFATGGKRISFAGALTEYAACPTANTPGCTFASLPPVQGWTDLYNALATVTSLPAVPVVTDLEADS